MTIQYFDALAGAGKTRSLVSYAKQLAHVGEQVLFVQPSKLLIDNTVANEMGQVHPSYDVKSIHGGNTQEVVKAIVRHTQEATGSRGRILFITHEAFMHLPYIENKRNWHLLFDEVPAVDVFDAINVPETHKIITDLMELRSHDAAYGRLVARDTQLAKIAKNKRADAVWRLFGDLTNRITSPHWAVYALQSNYHSLCRNDGFAKQLVTYSLLQPSMFQGFRQTIIASALFKSSCLYQLWTAEGVTLESVNAALSSNLKYHAHENGRHMTINYVMEGNWSKSLRDKKAFSGNSEQDNCLREKLPNIIMRAMNGEAFAWMANKDIPDDYFQSDTAVRLPNSPHGLNSFQHLHNVVVLSALNPPPAHFHFMQARGVDADALRTAHYRSSVYQAVMRISVRNPDDAAPKAVVVMDQATAHWLAGLFPGAHVQPMNGAPISIPTSKPGRPRKHASGADRVRAFRERQRALRAGAVSVAEEHGFGAAYASIYDTHPLLHLDLVDDDEFVALLRELHRRKLPNKNANFLFSPAHFDVHVNDADTKRGLQNVRYVRGIWLDNDGGDLTHTAFARLFPTVRMVAWNTYSSTRAKPRWRCFIPSTHAVTAEAYKSIIEQLMLVLRWAGYGTHAEKAAQPHLRTHGFDTSKFAASSLFYAPCQAAEPKASFFIDYNQEGRIAIDAELWIEHDIRDIEAKAEEMEGRASAISADKAHAIQVATNRWRSAPRGQGNRAFYRLAQDLKRAGLTKAEIGTRLEIESKHASSPQDRAADAKRLSRSI